MICKPQAGSKLQQLGKWGDFNGENTADFYDYGDCADFPRK
jgi:hypothetical protein